jgi:hypothetical protein
MTARQDVTLALIGTFGDAGIKLAERLPTPA